MDQEPETQPVESLSLNKMGDQILSIFPQEHPQALRRRGHVLQRKSACGEPRKHLDSGKSVTHGGYRRIHAMAKLVAYIDGGSRGNPGSSGIGVVSMNAVGTAFQDDSYVGLASEDLQEILPSFTIVDV